MGCGRAFASKGNTLGRFVVAIENVCRCCAVTPREASASLLSLVCCGIQLPERRHILCCKESDFGFLIDVDEEESVGGERRRNDFGSIKFGVSVRLEEDEVREDEGGLMNTEGEFEVALGIGR